MNTPWISVVLRSTLIHPFNHFGCQPRCLTVFLFDVSRQFGVHKFKTRENVSVLIHATVSEVMRRGYRSCSLWTTCTCCRPYPIRIPGRNAHLGRDRHAVVTHVGIKAAFMHTHTDDAIRAIPSRLIPSQSARIWVLPMRTQSMFTSRKWSPIVLSPTRSGTPFHEAPWLATYRPV